MIAVANTSAGAVAPLRVLIYGPPGSGKTCFAATFPRPIVIDTDGGLLSIRTKSVDYIRCRTLSDVREAFQLIVTRQAEYQTVVVDSLTELARIVLEGVTAQASEPRATLRQWSDTIAILRRLVRAINDLPLHVVYTATAREVKNQAGETLAVRPWLPGQFGQEVVASMDLVGFVDTTSGGRNTLLTRPRGVVYAKDRSGSLPANVPLDFETISAAISAAPSAVA